jgi:death-on-curing family protein
MAQPKYPTVDDLIEINRRVLNQIRVRKADRPALIIGGRAVLANIMGDVKNTKGDVFDKAVVLLKGIIQRHRFESGNRRTAIVSTASFLEVNGEKLNITHELTVLQGIREGYYTDGEIKNWIKGGEIRAFKRK